MNTQELANQTAADWDLGNLAIDCFAIDCFAIDCFAIGYFAIGYGGGICRTEKSGQIRKQLGQSLC